MPMKQRTAVRAQRAIAIGNYPKKLTPYKNFGPPLRRLEPPLVPGVAGALGLG